MTQADRVHSTPRTDSSSDPHLVHYYAGQHTYVQPGHLYRPSALPSPSDCTWMVPRSSCKSTAASSSQHRKRNRQRVGHARQKAEAVTPRLSQGAGSNERIVRPCC
jgi:hypothetical protein